MIHMIQNVSCTLGKFIMQFIQIQLTLRRENNLCCGWLPVDQLLAAAATTSSAPNGRTNNKYFLLEPISISCRTHFTDMLIWNGIGPVSFICTEGALRRPMTYDNHPIPSIHLIRHITLNELNRPKIDLSQPSMTFNDLIWTKMI